MKIFSFSSAFIALLAMTVALNAAADFPVPCTGMTVTLHNQSDYSVSLTDPTGSCPSFSSSLMGPNTGTSAAAFSAGQNCIYHFSPQQGKNNQQVDPTPLQLGIFCLADGAGVAVSGVVNEDITVNTPTSPDVYITNNDNEIKNSVSR